jgi:glycine cleavage system regulatory protein
MPNELRDLRAKITVETDAALDVISRVTGKDRSEIVRDILHRWSLEQVSISTLLQQRLKAEGLTGASEGGSGNGRS